MRLAHVLIASHGPQKKAQEYGVEGVARQMVFLLFFKPYSSSKMRPFRIFIEAVEIGNEHTLPVEDSHVLNLQILGVLRDLLHTTFGITCQQRFMSPFRPFQHVFFLLNAVGHRASKVVPSEDIRSFQLQNGENSTTPLRWIKRPRNISPQLSAIFSSFMFHFNRAVLKPFVERDVDVMEQMQDACPQHVRLGAQDICACYHWGISVQHFVCPCHIVQKKLLFFIEEHRRRLPSPAAKGFLFFGRF